MEALLTNNEKEGRKTEGRVSAPSHWKPTGNDAIVASRRLRC